MSVRHAGCLHTGDLQVWSRASVSLRMLSGIR
jgi:hypothetical protein